MWIAPGGDIQNGEAEEYWRYSMGDAFPGKKEAGQNQQFSSLAKKPIMLAEKV